MTPPTIEPVTLNEAKAQLRVDFDDDDVYIQNLISVAREYCESFQNRAYMPQTFDLAFDNFPSLVFKVPRPPLKSVNHIWCYDEHGEGHEVTDFFVDVYSTPGRIAVERWPQITLRKLNGVMVQFVAGDSNVSNRVKQSILLLVSYWYDNRDAAHETKVSTETAFSVKALLGLDRVMPV
jgi:uncharacterized phiE125 gp8 family phage protein